MKTALDISNAQAQIDGFTPYDTVGTKVEKVDSIDLPNGKKIILVKRVYTSEVFASKEGNADLAVFMYSRKMNGYALVANYVPNFVLNHSDAFCRRHCEESLVSSPIFYANTHKMDNYWAGVSNLTAEIWAWVDFNFEAHQMAQYQEPVLS